VTEDTLALNAGSDIEIPDYLRAATPETEEASPVADSLSDRSIKSSLSPGQSPVTASQNLNPEAPATFPIQWNSLSANPTAQYNQRDLLFPAFEAHDYTFHTRSGAASYLSPTSSGSASLAMTGSTMATSIHSEDPSAGKLGEAASPWAFRPTTSHTEDSLARSWGTDSISIPSSCDNITRDIEVMSQQLINPAPLPSRYGANDIDSWMLLDPPATGQDPNEMICTCAVCHQPSASHFVSIHNTIPQDPPRSILNDTDTDGFEVPATTKDEGAWLWIALCFASCLNMKKGKGDLTAKSLADATTEFERLVSRRDRMLLTAANQMIAILHQHSQGQTAVIITASAKESVDRMLSADDPIRITFNYLAATADSSVSSASLQEMGVTSSSLYSVYQALNANPQYGSQHPYTISASYNHAWLLRREGNPQEAEQRLHHIYEISCSIFGKSHMQSITAMATLAGTQFDQKKTTEAISNFKIMIRDCKPTLGKSHPYRLEAKRRLAWQYEDLGQDGKMVPLYWEVLEGRVRMLGRKHPYTLSQREDYEELMKKLGRWDVNAQREVEGMFKEPRRAEEEATRRRRSGSNESRESECAAF
jgi:hypothetical protein